MLPFGTKHLARENKKYRPKVDPSLRKMNPKQSSVKARLIWCPRLCLQHTTPAGNLSNGKKTYDPVTKHCHHCGLTK